MLPKHRIFIDTTLGAGLEVQLDSERAHYLTRVLRIKNADLLICFNGNGRSYLARLACLSPTKNAKNLTASLLITSALPSSEGNKVRIHLVLALIKKPDKVLQKITELGVTDIWLVASQRTDTRLNEQRLLQKYKHWKAILISACEQSGRNYIPKLHKYRSFTEALSQTPAANSYILHPGAAVFNPDKKPQDTVLMFGPEGGWTDEEMKLANSKGACAASLGGNVLRADTAPIATLAILQHAWKWQLA